MMSCCRLKALVVIQLLDLILTARAAVPSIKQFAVEGVVYCRDCNLPGPFNTNPILSSNASPLPGAIVQLRCFRNSIHNDGKVAVNGTTDSTGRFFLMQTFLAVKSSGGVSSCKIYLVSSPFNSCSVPDNLNAGVTGARLQFERTASLSDDGSNPYKLYGAGFFEFGPSSPGLCPLV